MSRTRNQNPQNFLHRPANSNAIIPMVHTFNVYARPHGYQGSHWAGTSYRNWLRARPPPPPASSHACARLWVVHARLCPPHHTMPSFNSCINQWFSRDYFDALRCWPPTEFTAFLLPPSASLYAVGQIVSLSVYCAASLRNCSAACRRSFPVMADITSMIDTSGGLSSVFLIRTVLRPSNAASCAATSSLAEVAMAPTTRTWRKRAYTILTC